MSVANYLEAEVGQLGLTRAPPDARGMIRGPNGRPRAELNLGGLTAARQAGARNAWDALGVRAPRPGVNPVGQGGHALNVAAAAGNPAFVPVTLATAAAAPPQPVGPQAPPTAGPAGPAPAAITEALGEALSAASSKLELVDAKLGAQETSLAAATAKLDALGLRVGGQDNALTLVQQSVSALRAEYSAISQSTDGQSAARLEAAERLLAQLAAGFQEFSARTERELQQLQRDVGQAARPPVEDGYRAAIVLDAATGLPPLTPVMLRGEARVGDGGVYLRRQSYDPAKGLTDVDCLAELADGTPCVAFV